MTQRGARRIRRLIPLLAAWTAQTGLACGPWFPNRIIDEGDSSLLQAPLAVFALELQHAWPGAGSTATADGVRGAADDPALRVAAAEREDFAAWRWQHSAARDADVLRDRLEVVRSNLAAHAQAVEQWNAAARCPWRRADEPLPERPRFIEPPVPDGLPSEFALYLQGAVAWHAGRTNAAVAAWDAVLALPPDKRRFRSTWAAYMLGRAAQVRGDGPAAIARFRLVREMAGAGMADSLGLAVSSLGWEARAELDRGQEESALDLYVRQYRAGDASAANSLRFLARDLWNGPPARLRALAANAEARRLLVAYALSHFPAEDPDGSGDPRLSAFLEAVEQAGVGTVEDADRLAWGAYRAGRFDLAARWAALAAPESVMAKLVRAKP
jgi:hypothetical protein